MSFFLILFPFLVCSNEIEFYSENTHYKNKKFYFEKEIFMKSEQGSIRAEKGVFHHPFLSLQKDVICLMDSAVIKGDLALIDIQNRWAKVSAKDVVSLRDERLLLTCKEAFFQKDSAVFKENAQLCLEEGTISSDTIEVDFYPEDIKIKGNFEGLCSSFQFSYNGSLLYTKNTKRLTTLQGPFLAHDDTFAIKALKASLFLGDRRIDKILLEGPVEMTSETIQALCPELIILPKEDKYLLKGDKQSPVFLWKEGALLSVLEACISYEEEKEPFITTTGVVTLSLTEQEIKHLNPLKKP